MALWSQLPLEAEAAVVVDQAIPEAILTQLLRAHQQLALVAVQSQKKKHFHIQLADKLGPFLTVLQH
jgi:hypothetical protein